MHLKRKKPVLFVGGAGTGKTRAITHRIAYSCAIGVMDPQRVMAITFTARAAGATQTPKIDDLFRPADRSGGGSKFRIQYDVWVQEGYCRQKGLHRNTDSEAGASPQKRGPWIRSRTVGKRSKTNVTSPEMTETRPKPTETRPTARDPSQT